MTEQVDQLERLDQVQAKAQAALEAVQDEAALAQWKTNYLGRSSPLMQTFTLLPQIPKELRPQVGQRANQVKQALEAALAQRSESLRAAALQRSLETARLDVTLPGRLPVLGRLHPVTQTFRELFRIFAEMGFQVYCSREVETDEYNFQLLNFPPYHPARDMQDTFFIDTDNQRPDNPLILRTHTSPGQIRAMHEYAAMDPENPPDIRIVLPGMCYRYEQVTARSEMQFNQLEGLAVGHGITLGDMKGTLTDFAHRMFGEDVRTRLRPSYFPFTEPSGEMDVECFVCGGQGCAVCKNSGWLEVLGCGMVHPVVLQNGGYDPEVYSGFAWGGGVERLAMLRYRIEDIRYFWQDDVRFLGEF